VSGNTRDIVLVTGQSGIKIVRCLKKLGTRVSPKSIDSTMARIANREFWEILALPPRIQEDLWTHALGRIVKGLPAVSDARREPALLTFHASYYHPRTRGFTSPVSLLDLLTLKPRVRMIIVLIDDCYDVYKRLMARGEMYSHVLVRDERSDEASKPEDALVDSLLNLVTILEWREVEIAFSRKIAGLLEVPCFVVAVKHPVFLAKKLIKRLESCNTFYLAHPISNIRSEKSPRPPEFYEELSHFIRDVSSKDRIIAFVPDTIDELRVGHADKGKRIEYVPELREAWPIPFSDEWLWEPLPDEVRDINPLNPLSFQFDAADAELRFAVSALLHALSEKIIQQINSRDHILVEQSTQGVIAYRPCWEGFYASGVAEELKYNHELRTDYGEAERTAAILTRKDDLAKWRLRELFTYVSNHIELPDEGQTEGVRDKINAACEKTLQDRTWVTQFATMPLGSGARSRLKDFFEKMLPTDYRFSKDLALPLGGGAMEPEKHLAAKQHREQCWQAVFEKVSHAQDPTWKFLRKSTKGQGIDDKDTYDIADSRTSFTKQQKSFVKTLIQKRGMSRRPK